MADPRVMVVQPDPTCGLDRFAGWLAEDAVDTRTVRPFDGDDVPERLEHDGLVVLGGDMSALDDDRYPWLADIRALLRDAVDTTRPVLGICLGGQLLAQSCGGTVTVGPHGPEIGVAEIDWRPAAADDDLVAGLGAHSGQRFRAATWHGDVVADLPPDAVWLGATGTYPHQAFRVGPSAWGVQFHPEVSPAGFRAWVDGAPDPDPATAARLADAARAVAEDDPAVRAGTRELVRRFAAVLRRARR